MLYSLLKNSFPSHALHSSFLFFLLRHNFLFQNAFPVPEPNTDNSRNDQENPKDKEVEKEGENTQIDDETEPQNIQQENTKNTEVITNNAALLKLLTRDKKEDENGGTATENEKDIETDKENEELPTSYDATQSKSSSRPLK